MCVCVCVSVAPLYGLIFFHLIEKECDGVTLFLNIYHIYLYFYFI